jgi:hypothetical protein
MNPHFTEIRVDEPIEALLADWNLLEERVSKRFLTFASAGDNVLGVRRRDIGRDEVRESSTRKGQISVVALELLPEGPQLHTFKAMRIHVTVAGVPHRVPHSFGYWHINDMDELYLPLPSANPNAPGHFVVLMQQPHGKQGESFAWYCERCLTLLHEYRYASGVHGIAGFWRAEMAAVREYNDDVANRTCPECGLENPLAYCAARSKDLPAETAARELW